MSWELNFEEAKEDQEKFNGTTLSFGIPYLDDAAGGILFNDVIILSAKTGFGKTELASIIANHNAMQGKKVYYFALEAFKNEILFRNAYRLASRAFYNDNKRSIDVSFMDYMKRIIPIEALPYFEDAEQQARVMGSNLHVKYKQKDYGIKDFEKDLSQICFDANLIIIDHLQYFDYDTARENSEITAIVKKIRDLTLNSEVPIILISHLRKTYNVSSKPIPSIDDIFGTSNIQKIASKVIIISPDFQNEAAGNEKFSTLFRVAKNRYYGSVERFVGILHYDSMHNNYSRDYKIGRLNFNEDEYKILQEKEVPVWCASLKNKQHKML